MSIVRHANWRKHTTNLATFDSALWPAARRNSFRGSRHVTLARAPAGGTWHRAPQRMTEGTGT